MERFTDRVVLIAGGATGIGYGGVLAHLPYLSDLKPYLDAR